MPPCPGGSVNISGAIPFAQITRIVQPAANHPVFRCQVGPGNTARCFVVKFEMAAKRSHVQDPIEVMREIDNSARARTLNRKVREFAATFKQPGTLEKLGEIIAVDAFMGNFDRINFAVWADPPQEARTVDGKRLACMQNFGNFFLSKEKLQGWTPVGYDNVDYTSPFKDLSSLPDDVFYPGFILKTDQAAIRQRVAQAVFDDFNTLLGPRNRSVFKPTAKKTYMPSNGVPRIQAGIEAGATRLLNYLKGRYANGGISPELQRRLHACGWLTRSNFPRLN